VDANLEPFFRPRTVAVVGASRHRGTIGGEVFHNAISAGYTGVVHPVNRAATAVQGVTAYPAVSEVPGPVDLAIIVVPAADVCAVTRDCAGKGVPAITVISAGFAEAGEAGAARQRELAQICREAGMRLIGPNCMGLLNARPEVRLNATFASRLPPAGRVGFLSQSGALGLAVIEYAHAEGLGISQFVSVGNKADVSGNDLLEWWETDDDTSVVLLYLESFGNPRRFARIARRVGRTKPIVALKSGRSAAGLRGTTSHTGAMLAASDVTVDALFAQAGVVRCDTMAEMFQVASLLSSQPVPRGNRVAILSNGGGPGILCADACEAEGLAVEPLPEAVQQRLAAFLPPEAAVGNPIDMVISATAADYRRAIEVLAGCEVVDAVIVIFVPPIVTRSEDALLEVQRAAERMSSPLLTVFMSDDHKTSLIPNYAFPEDAARALGNAVRYGRWRATPEGNVPQLSGIHPEAAAGLLDAARARGAGWLEPEEVLPVLSQYGITVIETRFVTTAEEAGAAAAELAGPVALKAIAPGLVHKTELGAVKLHLDPEDVTEAAEQLRERLLHSGIVLRGFVVQPMAGEGVEMLAGVVRDRSFGPVLACGAGGTSAEILRDVAVRISPVTDRDASDMVRSLKTFPLLDGFRGAPKVDVAAFEDVLLRVGTLVDLHPELIELDLNPVLVSPSGAVVVDARIRLEHD